MLNLSRALIAKIKEYGLPTTATCAGTVEFVPHWPFGGHG
jgi:hypothetical protein